MKLRKEQMDALAHSREERFVAEMVRHLRTDLPSHCIRQGLSEPDLEPFVRKGLAAAHEHGLTSDDGVRQYLECLVVFAPDFDRHPGYADLGRIVNDHSLTDAEKTDALSWRLLTQGSWKEPKHG